MGLNPGCFVPHFFYKIVWSFLSSMFFEAVSCIISNFGHSWRFDKQFLNYWINFQVNFMPPFLFKQKGSKSVPWKITCTGPLMAKCVSNFCYLWMTPCEKMTAVKQNRPLAPIYLGVKPFLPKRYTLTQLRTYQVLMHKILVTTNWLLCTKCSSLHNGRDGCNKLTV